MASSSLTQTALILTVNPNSVAIADGTVAYGYVGAPVQQWTGTDSGAQGMPWVYAKEWIFQAIQVGPVIPSGYTISIYGTCDSRIILPSNIVRRLSPYEVDTVQAQPNHLPIPLTQALGDISLPPSSWALLPSTSEQAGVGQIDDNPLIAVGQIMHAKRPLLAVRAVLTVSAAPVGSMAICVTAVC